MEFKPLDLYRASAGSGKTYTLARKYIWYLITIKEEEKPRRLRTEKELADSARHILAVTFTNKATAEMQQRIVSRLDDLAHIKPVYALDDKGNRYIKSPEYMRDFVDDLKVSPDRIAGVAAMALHILLENYSDFKVSTIDSFFQLVLRTFAYESELNDSYQVEIDSEFLSQMAVDGTLELFDTDHDIQDPEMSDARYWVSAMMRGAKGSWNIFARKMSEYNSSGLYSSLISSVKKLENEDYKRKRKEIDTFLDSTHDLRRIYEESGKHYNKFFEKFVQDCVKLKNSLPADILDRGQAGQSLKALLSRLFKYADGITRDYVKRDIAEIDTCIDKVFSTDQDKLVCKTFKGSRDQVAASLKCFKERYEAFRRSEFFTWQVYAKNFPYLALFGLVNRMRRDYLAESNSMELGETTTILREVIGDSDAPFVYERLGSVLNHFLIDEFQDTSKLQWENLRPLLDESMSHDNESLIIGDPKQSIYRFRNADSSLITTGVPEYFRGRVNIKGMIPADNRNFRSRLRVVQFNNSFFEYLVKRLDDTQINNPKRQIFGRLYENVVQLPNNTDPTQGYVSVAVAGKNQKNFKSWTLGQIPLLITDMLSRGYRQKDIAVLVYSAPEGGNVIDSILKYNNENPETAPIEFVSEQSLLVANSPAVKLIVGVLENMARGFNPDITPAGERQRKGIGNWPEIETGFKFFVMSQGGEGSRPMADMLNEYIDGEPDFGAITGMLDRLNSLSIPAIVEAVVASFIPESMLRSEASFIAAFQDLVLEYCERMPTDIGSFLDWWSRKSKKASIASPEDKDAVRIMTYHKSKGLEFDCVIIPFADWDMSESVQDSKVEWRWLRPAIPAPDGYEFPPYLPVNIDSGLRGTVHENALNEFYDELKTDYLNQAYVAFTRAGRELYVFSGQQEKTGSSKSSGSGSYATAYCSFGEYLRDFMQGKGGNTGAGDMARLDTSEIELPQTRGEIVDSEDPESEPFVASVGEKTADASMLRKGDDTGSDNDRPKIREYRSSIKSKLLVRAAENPESLNRQLELFDSDEIAEEEVDLDPQSEGNLKHAIMERVEVVNSNRDDLPAALRHLLVMGLIDQDLAKNLEADLRQKLNNPAVARWFDGNAEVINERPLLLGNRLTRRPDRILVYPGGHAVVVDYKFGKYPGSHGTHRKYHTQIREYVHGLLSTGRFISVKGYLWYVNEDKIEDSNGKVIEIRNN